MKYPSHLLPLPHYQLIVADARLLGYFLVRQTPDRDLLDPETGLLKQQYIVPQSDHLRDFSTNLLGTFDLSDNAIVLCCDSERKRYFNALWSPGTTGEAPEYLTEFNLDERKGCFFLAISDLTDSKTSFQLNDGTISYFTCTVLHTPTHSNFWHFSVRSLVGGEHDLISQKGKWVERLLKTEIRTLIQQKARFEAPAYEAVPQDFFA